jgi:hypothetical protein
MLPTLYTAIFCSTMQIHSGCGLAGSTTEATVEMLIEAFKVDGSESVHISPKL